MNTATFVEKIEQLYDEDLAWLLAFEHVREINRSVTFTILGEQWRLYPNGAGTLVD